MWKFFKDRFYGPSQKDARDAWVKLRFSDFADVGRYNSALHGATSRLKLSGREITENDMIEKTLFTI
jgi:hypothetical protein